jgi:hypothetical protein
MYSTIVDLFSPRADPMVYARFRMLDIVVHFTVQLAQLCRDCETYPIKWLLLELVVWQFCPRLVPAVKVFGTLLNGNFRTVVIDSHTSCVPRKWSVTLMCKFRKIEALHLVDRVSREVQRFLSTIAVPTVGYQQLQVTGPATTAAPVLNLFLNSLQDVSQLRFWTFAVLDALYRET